MPTVQRIGAFRFHFYSDEGREPPHSHGECKFWLVPVSLARNNGIKPHQVREIEGLVYAHRDLLRQKYEEIHRH